ncbi:MAG: hypothetical protein ACOY0T_26515 [Myxococcota bacterium]
MNTTLKYAVSLVLLWPCSLGCGRTEQDSALNGRVAVNSFPSAPTSIEARAQDGRLVQVALGADGAFHLPLKPGTYTVSVVMSDAREPLVFPRKNGQLDSTFTVSSPNASVYVGEIRHLTSAPSAGFTMMGTGASCASNQVCVDDDGATSCDGEEDQEDQDDEQEGEHHDERATPEPDAPDLATGESIFGPMALAEHNVPDRVGCSESHEEHED